MHRRWRGRPASGRGSRLPATEGAARKDEQPRAAPDDDVTRMQSTAVQETRFPTKKKKMAAREEERPSGMYLSSEPDGSQWGFPFAGPTSGMEVLLQILQHLHGPDRSRPALIRDQDAQGSADFKPGPASPAASFLHGKDSSSDGRSSTGPEAQILKSRHGRVPTRATRANARHAPSRRPCWSPSRCSPRGTRRPS